MTTTEKPGKAARAAGCEAAARPEDAVARPRISSRELLRRAWHMAPGLLPFVLWAYPHRDPISPTLRAILLAVIVGLAAAIYTQYRYIARRKSQANRLPAVAGYAASVLLMLLLFPGHAELGLTVLAVLAFGDGSATLGGLLVGGRRLPWNGQKTWSGLISFLAAGTPTSALIYWGETHNPEALPPGGVSFSIALVCGGSATLAAAVLESLPSGINDNIRVGAAASAAVLIAQSAFVGWS